jgi:hypothetical protein
MPPSSGSPKAVIVVSSHVARGSVGNRAAVFALEVLGHPVWAVPTVILPWHPGHGRATRIVPGPAEFAALMRDLENARWLGEVGAVLSGYLGHPEQAEAVASLVAAVKARNGAALYVCDPVMGDSGGLYVPAETASAIRDRLLPLADIATPNCFELEWLSGRQLPDVKSVLSAALDLGPPTMLVTSAPALLAGSIGNRTPSQRTWRSDGGGLPGAAACRQRSGQGAPDHHGQRLRDSCAHRAARRRRAPARNGRGQPLPSHGPGADAPPAASAPGRENLTGKLHGLRSWPLPAISAWGRSGSWLPFPSACSTATAAS